MSLSIGKHQVSFDDAQKEYKKAEVFLTVDEHGLFDQNDLIHFTPRHFFFIKVPGRGNVEVLFRGEVPDSPPFFIPREEMRQGEYDPLEDLLMQ